MRALGRYVLVEIQKGKVQIKEDSLGSYQRGVAVSLGAEVPYEIEGAIITWRKYGEDQMIERDGKFYNFVSYEDIMGVIDESA